MGEEEKLRDAIQQNGDNSSTMIPTLQTLPPDDDINDHALHNGIKLEGEDIYIDEDEDDDDEDEEEEDSNHHFGNINSRSAKNLM